MPPRFTNPHFVAQAIEQVDRSDLFDGPKSNNTDGEELELQKTLNELIESSLDANTSVRAKKKRKLNPPSVEDAVQSSVLFRLLSTPHTISLLPPPPPPPVTREPECEDTEPAAETRRQWAAVVACDAAGLCRKPRAFRHRFAWDASRCKGSATG
ncbi:hypothetical protein K438DRAFT_2013476 [Mycena galopus ATCC 62051]|nr:hypothetical protein K438DRAFT_2013476 [Mycena galopus ATCC 62051]